MKKTLLSMLFVVSSVNAEFITGNMLLSWMESSSTAEQGAARGYIAGVIDGTQGIRHCAPDGISIKQVMDMTKVALTNVPEKRNVSADVYVAGVAAIAWPCKPKKGDSI